MNNTILYNKKIYALMFLYSCTIFAPDNSTYWQGIITWAKNHIEEQKRLQQEQEAQQPRRNSCNCGACARIKQVQEQDKYENANEVD